MTTLAASCGLLAAGLDWLEGLLPVLFVGFWIVSQVFAALRRGQPGDARRPPRAGPARPPALPGGGEGNAADPRRELERQIAEFLRESSGEPRRPAKRGVDAAKPPRRPRAPLAPGTDVGTFKTRRREGRVAPDARPPTMANVPVAGRLEERSPRDDSIARHVHEAFAHDLAHVRGDLPTAPPPPAGEPPAVVATQAQELMRLLRQPATVRQVILLGAILERPVDRW